MTPSPTRVTRLVLVGTIYRTVSATVEDFDKMEQTGNVRMIAQYNPDGDVWVYFDGEARPPFRFEELI